MKPLRPQLRGLIFKLALFYVLLSLPSLMLVESAILIFEFESFMHGVEGGSLVRASALGADELAGAWPQTSVDERRGLDAWVQSWVLRLQRPRGDLIGRDSYILDELAIDPIAAAVLAPDGRVLAKAPANAAWQLELPRASSAPFRAALAASAPQLLAGTDTPYKVRRVLTPVHGGDGAIRGLLLVELRLPVPWHRFLLDLSLEWPIVLGYLIVFGIASSIFLATWVTRRLNRVARAAAAWCRGDFSDRIGDRSRDELGNLSALLDGMALELKALMQSRAQLATLSERQRLARDLHDTVKQQAFALNMQLAALRRQLGAGPAAERIAQAERLSGNIQRELAQILDELRGPDATLPFAERVRLRALEWAQVSGIALDCDLANVAGVPAETQDALLRIVDEALANVLRHSAATHAAVAMRAAGRTLELAITDNGRGGIGEAAGGMGIANMRARAAALAQGSLSIDSSPAGSRIVVECAIAGAEPAPHATPSPSRKSPT
jgi:signal transduction histidine kinase